MSLIAYRYMRWSLLLWVVVSVSMHSGNAEWNCSAGAWCFTDFSVNEYLIAASDANMTQADATAYCLDHAAELADGNMEAWAAWRSQNAHVDEVAWTRTSVVIIGDVPSQDRSTPMQSWNPRETSSAFRSSCFALETSLGLVSLDCAAAAFPLCSRRGLATSKWNSSFTSEFEYALNPRAMSFDDARIACQEAHGDLAFVQGSSGDLIDALITGISSSLWIGFDSRLLDPWLSSSPAKRPAVVTAPNECGWIDPRTGVLGGSVCSALRPSLCSRLKVAPNRTCFTPSGVHLRYVYAAADSSVAGFDSGTATAVCEGMNSSVSELLDFSETMSCFSSLKLAYSALGNASAMNFTDWSAVDFATVRPGRVMSLPTICESSPLRNYVTLAESTLILAAGSILNLRGFVAVLPVAGTVNLCASTPEVTMECFVWSVSSKETNSSVSLVLNSPVSQVVLDYSCSADSDPPCTSDSVNISVATETALTSLTIGGSFVENGVTSREESLLAGETVAVDDLVFEASEGLSLSFDLSLGCILLESRNGTSVSLAVTCFEIGTMWANVSLSCSGATGVCLTPGLSASPLLRIEVSDAALLHADPTANVSALEEGNFWTVNATRVPSNATGVVFACLVPIEPPSFLSVGTSCFMSSVNISSLQVSLTVKDFSTLQNVTDVSFTLRGPAAAMYGNTTISVTVVLHEYSIRLFGLREMEFAGHPVVLNIDIRAPLPEGEELTMTLLLEELSNTTCGFNASTAVTATRESGSVIQVSWLPTCAVTANVSLLVQGGALASLFSTPLDTPLLVVVLPQSPVVEFGRSLVFVGGSFAVGVTLPTDLAEGTNFTLVLFAESYTTDGPLGIDPPQLLWESNTAETQHFHLMPTRVAHNVVLRWEIHGTSIQYIAPQPLTVSVHEQGVLRASLVPRQFYYTGILLQIRADLSAPPMDGNLTVAVEGIGVVVTSEVSVIEEGHQMSAVVNFTLLPRVLQGVSVEVRFVLGGLAAPAFAPAESSIVVQPVLPRIRLHVKGPPFLLFGFGSTIDEKIGTLSLSIDRAPSESAIVVVQLSSSASLGLSQTTVEWHTRESRDQIIGVSSVKLDQFAVVNYTVYSVDRDGAPTSEAYLLHGSVDIPVRAKTMVTFSRNQVHMRVGRSNEINVDIDTTPTLGAVLNITLSTTEHFSVSPQFLLFYPNSAPVAPITLLPITPALIEGALTVRLTGNASRQFTLPTDRIRVYIDERLSIRQSFPSAVIVGHHPIDVVVDVSELPEQSTTLQVTYSTGADAIVIEPSVVVWSTTSSLKQVVRVTALYNLVEPVVVSWVVSGTAKGYANGSTHVIARVPAFPVVTFPSAIIYAGENVSVLVNLTEPVVSPSHLLTFRATLTTDCVACQLLYQELTWSSTDTSVNKSFVVSTPPDLEHFSAVILNLTASGQAINEFNFSSLPMSGEVFLRPKRFVRCVDLPPVFYLHEATSVTVELEELPDPGTFVSVRAMGAQSLTSWNISDTNRFKQILVMFTTSNSDGKQPLELLVFGSSRRYQAAPAAMVNITSKLHIASLSSLRPEQVIGGANNQSVTIRLNRHPLAPLIITPRFTSPLTGLLRFTPPVLEWDVLDNETSSLERTVWISGELVGDAFSLQFELEGMSGEIHPPVSTALSKLRILPLRTVSFAGAPNRIYVGNSNAGKITVKISSSPFSPLVLRLKTSPGNLTEFRWNNAPLTDGLLVVPALTESLSFSVVVVGVNKGFGAVSVAVVSGTEFDPVIDGSFEVTIVPLIFPLLFCRGVAVPPYGSINVTSDQVYPWSISLQNLHETNSSTFSINVNSPPESLKNRIYITNTSFVFPPVTAGKFTGFFSTAVVSFTVEQVLLSVITPTATAFAPGFYVRLLIVPEPRIVALNFSGVVYVGRANTNYFFLVPERHPGAEGLDMTLDLSECLSDAISVTQERELHWPGDVSLRAVRIVAVATSATSETCTLRVRKRRSLAPGIVFFEGSLTVTQAPSVAFHDGSWGVEVSYRQVARETSSFVVVAKDVPFAETQSVAMSANENDVPPNTSILLVPGSSQPKGFAATLRITDVHVAIADHGPNITLSFLPLTELFLVRPEVLTVVFLARAFRGNIVPLTSRDRVQIRVTEYTPSVVVREDVVKLTAASVTCAALGSFLSPVAVMQARKATSLLSIFDCPNKEWRTKPELFWSVDGESSTLGTWMALVAVRGGIIAAVFLLQFFIVVGLYLQRKQGSKRTFTSLCARARFPALSFLWLFFELHPTAHGAMRVLSFSTVVPYRIVAAFLILAPLCVGVPIAIHGVVWRNRSITFSVPPEKPSLLKAIFVPCGTWVHPTNQTYLPRFFTLFFEHRQHFRWYVLFEYVFVLGFAALETFEPSEQSGCVSKVAAIGALLAFEFVAVVMWRPFHIGYMNGLMGLVFLLQLAAAFTAAAEIGKDIRNDARQRSAVNLIFASVVLYCVGLFIRLVLFPLVEYKKRKDEKTRTEKERDHVPIANGDVQETLSHRLLHAPILDTELDGGIEDDEAVSDDDELDVENDPDLALAIEEAEKEAYGGPVSGVFRDKRNRATRGNEHSFSPLRNSEIEAKRTVEARGGPPRVRAAASDASSPSPQRQLRDYHWLEEAANDAARNQQRRKDRMDAEARRSAEPRIRAERYEVDF